MHFKSSFRQIVLADLKEESCSYDLLVLSKLFKFLTITNVCISLFVVAIPNNRLMIAICLMHLHYIHGLCYVCFLNMSIYVSVNSACFYILFLRFPSNKPQCLVCAKCINLSFLNKLIVQCNFARKAISRQKFPVPSFTNTQITTGLNNNCDNYMFLEFLSSDQ